MSPEQAEVHRKLLSSLPVRTIVSPDDVQRDASRKRRAASAVRARAARMFAQRKAPSPIEQARARDRLMLGRMRPGVWYSAKVLAAFSGMEDKAFFTHVRRMVKRGQLVRDGSRHSFRYRKDDRSGL